MNNKTQSDTKPYRFNRRWLRIFDNESDAINYALGFDDQNQAITEVATSTGWLELIDLVNGGSNETETQPTLKFPNPIKTKDAFTRFEIMPALDSVDDGNGKTCVVPAKDMQEGVFFGVYGRMKNGLVEHITDFSTYSDAIMLLIQLGITETQQ